MNKDTDINQAMEGLTLWHNEISSFDNNVRDETENLRIVCLNLQMEGSRYKVPTIDPIAKNLAASIVKLNTQCNLLINKGRNELIKYTRFIFKYIEGCQESIATLTGLVLVKEKEIESLKVRNESLTEENRELIERLKKYEPINLK